MVGLDSTRAGLQPITEIPVFLLCGHGLEPVVSIHHHRAVGFSKFHQKLVGLRG